MPENPASGAEEGKQATADLKSGINTLQQLTSSAEAAKKHRDDSKHERAERMLFEAFETTAKSQGNTDKRGEKN